MSLCCMWDNKVFTFQIAKYFGVGGLRLWTPFRNVETGLCCAVIYNITRETMTQSRSS